MKQIRNLVMALVIGLLLSTTATAQVINTQLYPPGGEQPDEFQLILTRTDKVRIAPITIPGTAWKDSVGNVYGLFYLPDYSVLIVPGDYQATMRAKNNGLFTHTSDPIYFRWPFADVATPTIRMIIQ